MYVFKMNSHIFILLMKYIYFYREIKKNDIVFPDQCRVVTQQLNCPYYESSVLEGFGVYDMFENVCRAALLYRLINYCFFLKFCSKIRMYKAVM